MSRGLEILPKFHIESLQLRDAGDYLLRGRIDGISDPTIPWFWLCLSKDDFVLPRIVDLGADHSLISAVLDAKDVSAQIHPGVSLPWIGPGWQGFHVSMILDGTWEQRIFEASDALHFD